MTSTEAFVQREEGGLPKLEKVTLGSLKPDEAYIDLVATGICGTDVACMNGVVQGMLPAILGHEGAGIVAEVGSNVTDVQKGDKVLLNYVSCGSCEFCADGYPAYCEKFEQLNYSGKRADGSAAIEAEGGGAVGHNFYGQSSFARRAVVQKGVPRSS